MGNYTFRLQPVLALRVVHRDQQRERLADALATLQELASRKADLLAELRQASAQAPALGTGRPMDIRQLVELQRYEQVLRERLELLTLQHEGWQQQLPQLQANLELAERDVKALQKVDQRGRTLHRQHQQLLETKQLDEIIASRNPIQ